MFRKTLLNDIDVSYSLLRCWYNVQYNYVKDIPTSVKVVDKNFQNLCNLLLNPFDKKIKFTLHDLRKIKETHEREIFINLMKYNDYVNMKMLITSKVYLGPIVWEFLFHILSKKLYHDNVHYLKIFKTTFEAFTICICGIHALAYLNQNEKYLYKMSWQQNLFLAHEYSKLNRDAMEFKIVTLQQSMGLSLNPVYTLFRNYLFACPLKEIFKMRNTILDMRNFRPDNVVLYGTYDFKEMEMYNSLWRKIFDNIITTSSFMGNMKSLIYSRI
ncbi:hypothetical protein PV328_012444, partial [Microctonus aethiopoides]